MAGIQQMKADSLFRTLARRSWRAGLRAPACVAIGAALLTGSPAAGDAGAEPWTVFTPATADLPMSENRVRNAGFENGADGLAEGWSDYMLGYEIDDAGGRLGGRALRLSNRIAADSRGAVQTVTLDQTEPRPIYFSGWSKAESVGGDVGIDHEIPAAGDSENVKPGNH